MQRERNEDLEFAYFGNNNRLLVNRLTRLHTKPQVTHAGSLVYKNANGVLAYRADTIPQPGQSEVENLPRRAAWCSTDIRLPTEKERKFVLYVQGASPNRRVYTNESSSYRISGGKPKQTNASAQDSLVP